MTSLCMRTRTAVLTTLSVALLFCLRLQTSSNGIRPCLTLACHWFFVFQERLRETHLGWEERKRKVETLECCQRPQQQQRFFFLSFFSTKTYTVLFHLKNHCDKNNPFKICMRHRQCKSLINV